jgi:RNA polymerase sigma-70 factor (ECF subfamily)
MPEPVSWTGENDAGARRLASAPQPKAANGSGQPGPGALGSSHRRARRRILVRGLYSAKESDRMSGPTSEQRLLELLQAGDEQIAEQIFTAYAGRLLDLARLRISGRLARRIDPEDVVQSVFRTFFRRARAGGFTIEGEDSLCRILVGITARKALRQVAFQRAAKRNPGLEQDSSSGEAPDLYALEPTPDATVAFLDHLEHFLARLRPRDCSIVEMRMEGYSVEEIARKLELSDRHVRRVLKHVREIAEQEEFTPGGPP